MIHPAAAHLTGINIKFGGGPSIDDGHETMDLASRGTIDPTPLVGEVVPLEGLADAIDRAIERARVGEGGEREGPDAIEVFGFRSMSD